MKKIYVILLIALILLGLVGFEYTNLKDSSPTVAGAINKGLNGSSFGPVNYIIKELPVNGGEIVFYTRTINDSQIVFSTIFVKKKLNGWKATFYRGGMGGSSISDHPSAQAIQDMPILQMYLSKWKGVNVKPMIVGTIADPSISRIVIKNSSGLQRQATIISINDTFKIFYQFVSGKSGAPYQIIAYNSKGTVLKKVNVDQTSQSSSSSGTPISNH